MSLNCSWCRRDIYGNYTECNRCGGDYCSQNCFASHARQYHNYTGDLDEGDDCIITTATLNSFGGEDDSPALNLCRKFRDEVLSKSKEGNKLISNYYALAPLYLNQINNSQNSNEIFESIFLKFVNPGINLVTLNKDNEAMNLFKNFMDVLFENISTTSEVL